MNVRLPLWAFSLFVSLSSAFSSALYAFDLQRIERPAQFQAQWVSSLMQHNGMPMQVLKLQTALPLQGVQAAFESRWQQAGYFIQESKAADWLLLSTILDDHNVVLQMREEAGRTVAFLSAIPLDYQITRSNYANSFPKPWGTRVVSSTRSSDGGHTATTLVLSNKVPLCANRDFYRRALIDAGWQIDLDKEASGTVSFFASSRYGVLELVLRQDQRQTILFANIRHEEFADAFQ
jgi:hypothetical protein